MIDPATGAVIRTVTDSSLLEVDAAVSHARAAFLDGPWPALTRTERGRLLLRAADVLEEAAEDLYRLETRNNGRPVTETRAQLSRVPEWFRYNAGLLAAQR
ncbi:aldehyde dehydrogenase family protein, partial [Saccharopolyspora shandongensis]|uniref:aldehyde dehydrogenase family protein n=1 Tax=Saccharopolyspora shandongensis TaxID=418495 RepID=UPI003427AE48